ncbi:DUF3265 domain-containing protein [Vibrio parahaemolyticus]|nr:DUF3265 domain-containing protein [Vibrio parahaemolyticus]TOI58857.1 DUF3265 domain-containing protein [Vibrio parahaemolyticus]
MCTLTKRLRGILNAWHFQFDSALVFTAQWFWLGGGVVHPLTRRYGAGRKWTKS